MTDPNPSRRAVPTRPQRLLASPVTDASVDEIPPEEKFTRNRIEDMLREELRRRWVAPAEEFARLQIARLDGMILKLIGRIHDGDLQAIDRALTIINSLDQYPGFAKARHAVERYTEEDRARLMQKLNDVAARPQMERPEE
jgi:tRNA(Ile)-lysidine synthase TilS/MesJ